MKNLNNRCDNDKRANLCWWQVEPYCGPRMGGHSTWLTHMSMCTCTHTVGPKKRARNLSHFFSNIVSCKLGELLWGHTHTGDTFAASSATSAIFYLLPFLLPRLCNFQTRPHVTDGAWREANHAGARRFRRRRTTCRPQCW